MNLFKKLFGNQEKQKATIQPIKNIQKLHTTDTNQSLPLQTGINEKINFDKIIKLKQNNFFIYEEDWMHFNCTDQYKDALLRCLRYIKPEMYYNLFYRIIVEYDYEDLGKEVDCNNIIFELFNQFAEINLKRYCHILMPENNYIDSKYYKKLEWKSHHSLLCKHIEILQQSTIQYIINYPEIQRAIGVTGNENLFESKKCNLFFQTIMFFGFLMAKSRIIDEIDNKSYLGVEFINYNNISDLVIYLTPEGMSNKSKMSNNTREDDKKWYMDFLNLNNIKTINESINELEYNGEIYKRYSYYGDFINDYMIKRLNQNAISAILVQTQANFKKVKSI